MAAGLLPRSSAAVTAPGVRYQIDVRLDTERHRLEGWSTLFYRSGADTALPAIHLHAYPNAFSGPRTTYAREAVRLGEDYKLRLASPSERGWMTIDSVTADGKPARVALDETLARVDLPRPLAPGDSVALRLHFKVQIPIQFDRFGRTEDSYSIAQWYPKVVVHDDLGWHLDRFHYLSEFYGEYATFDVAITLPDRHWVGATGVPGRVAGGDNLVPLMESETPGDSVTVSLGAVLSGSVAGRWPRGGIEIETDLYRPGESEPLEATIPSGGRVTLRIPRGAPVHYSYRSGGANALEEADREGRPRPLHLLVAGQDTTIIDTLRAIAAETAPGDTVLPSLKTLRYRAERVHDFAWVASPDYVRSDTTWSGIQVRALVFREDEKRWRGLAAQTVDALRHFTNLVGPYAWPWFTSAEAYCGGSAMEYPMLVMNEPGMYSELFHELDDVNAHEAGHNWFYGMLGSDERAHPWLDEGFTQHIERDYTDTKYPLGLFRYTARFPWVGRYTAMDDNEQGYLARAWARDEQPMETPADGYLGWRTYGVGAYSKPASMLHTLRGIVGDSVFTAFLREYYRSNRFRHPRPPDVYKALSKVSGQDFSPFFHSWVRTIKRPGFALGKIRRERSGRGYRTEVTVRRTEAMVLPVAVEARFADGTRQERRVLARERETSTVFESGARLTRATLDPRHEIVEMDRLDNRSGGLPPMRFHFLAGFPSAEAIGVAFGPTIWHGESEGTRLGGWLEGRYLPSKDFPYGIRGFEAGLSVGTRDGSVAYRGGAWGRWGLLGARSRVRTLVARDEGLFRAAFSAGNTAMAPSRRHPYRSWSLALEYRDRDDLAPVASRYWSLGRTLEGALTLGLETIGPRRLEKLELSYRRGAAFRSDLHYDRVRITAAQTIDPFPGIGLSLKWRVAGGTAFRYVPPEIQFDIAEEGRLEALPLFYANDRGPLRETEHFYVPGGGGLRGYAGEAVLGRRLLAANVEIAQEPYPVFLFGDVGQVDPAGRLGNNPLVGRTLADAGLGARYGPIEVALPLWVGTPPPDESPWRFRWRLAIRPFQFQLPLP